MLRAIRPKKVWVLLIVFLLSAIFIAATPFIALAKKGKEGKKYDSSVCADIGENGGKFKIADGVFFVVPEGSLDADTTICIRMKRTKKKIKFYCGPAGTVFNISATLEVSGKWLKGVKDLTLHLAKSEKDEKSVKQIQPESMKHGVQWPIDHFSLYYFRRR